MGSKSSKRTGPHSSIAPAERGVIKKSGGEITGLPAGYGELLGEIKARSFKDGAIPWWSGSRRIFNQRFRESGVFLR